ncbi:hypothetical protein [Streptomyces sp. NRRL S-87]|uniref:hypothetical protein n=1 Tax=Streptomyces sp. NRRL S-87 TaxID=1463920 RepID=UPI0004BF7C7F|nr:hypothetical protein [Streptomyces sp. NRRL S-87]
MSTHTPTSPYPNLLRWLSGQAPDTGKITDELRTMAGGPQYGRFVQDLEDEREGFRAALLVAFPQVDLAKPDFPAPRQPLQDVSSETLRAAAVSCLTSLALGEAPGTYNPVHLWTGPDGALRYKGGAVHATVAGARRRILVDASGALYAAAAQHPFKLWLRKGGQDATVQHVVGMVAAPTGGYDACSAQGATPWESTYGTLDQPAGIVRAITRSGAFASIVWGASYCTAGWVESLMPTLSTQGLIPLPAGGSATIGQNVHSAQIVGSAWLRGVDGVDCKPDAMPPQWRADVGARLCPRAAQHVHLGHIADFCQILKAAAFQPGGTDLVDRIRYLLAHHPGRRADLESLPNIKKYYAQCF